ncbi:SusE domain-containing protein [Empedobacter brevis]|uniref:SusE domain-containing protein n=1 Tax=Empedobacter brevis TaxID=247 RepID=UPI0028A88CCD|nr:SusE domain-containing protein [Empedobacter brevis]
MKNFIKYISLACASVFALSACNDDEDIITLDPSTFVAPKLEDPTSNSLILLEENAAETAMTFKWSATEYGANTPAKYEVQIDKKGDEFKNAVTLISTTETSYAITVKDLNTTATELGLQPEKGEDLEYRIVSTIGSVKSQALISNIQTINVKIYIPKSDPVLYLVGGIQKYYDKTNWTPTDGLKMRYIGDGTTKLFEAYIKVGKDDGIKFIGQNDGWNPDNYGSIDGVQNGKLENSGSSSDVTIAKNEGDGFYYIQVDIDKLTYKFVKMNWGVIGDATADGWNSETAMTYNFTDNVFELSTKMKEGELKFRSKNSGNAIYGEDWKFNIGNQTPYSAFDTGAPNFKVSSKDYDLKVKINYDGITDITGL